MAGLSLIELMVAMTIALIAFLAATQLYNSTRQTYRVQTMQNRLSEDGRFVISMLQRVITQAGFRPLTNPPTAWGGFTTGAPLFPPVTSTSATSMTVRFIPDGTNQIGCNNAYGLGMASPGTPVEMVISSAAGGRLTCNSTGAVSAANWIDSAGAGTELMSFRLEYGVDTGPDTDQRFGCGPDGVAPGTSAGDCVADDYLPTSAAPTVMPADPSRIVAVRACVVLRSDTADASIQKSANWVDCWGVAIANSQNDRRLYRTFRTTVLLRNRL